jgi:SAM-dependent methyltransferase
MKTLLLGAGSRHDKRIFPDGKETWDGELITLDINPDHNIDVVWDLTDTTRLPWPADTFDEIHAYEVLEHIGQQGDFRTFFRQFSDYHRILKADGLFCASVPAPDSPWVWADPSHTRTILPHTLVFLSQQAYRDQVGVTAMSDFRFCYKADFECVGGEIQGDSYYFVLKAIK